MGGAIFSGDPPKIVGVRYLQWGCATFSEETLFAVGACHISGRSLYLVGDTLQIVGVHDFVVGCTTFSGGHRSRWGYAVFSGLRYL